MLGSVVGRQALRGAVAVVAAAGWVGHRQMAAASCARLAPDHGAQQASEDAAHALCTFMDKLTPLYFDVRGDDIEVETDPGGFYNRLLCGVQGARRRVVMTSLYLGTGKHEQDLVRQACVCCVCVCACVCMCVCVWMYTSCLGFPCSQ